ncbi:MAG TPA: ABC transporter substrate-binding protein [Cytophagaceae bacterium]|jgi:ABC-type branched-subunit amino acid transport system substrate-binding protein|nr:ABC transporter substrate-binding protein [Cytophagaceae bacterium]
MRLLKYIFCILLLPVVFNNGICQSAEFQAKYFDGKGLLKAGKYKEAMDQLMPLTSEAEGNPFVQYAHYYYSQAALKANLLSEGILMLKQLMEKYPSWEKMDEVNYLFGNILFEQKKYKEGMKYLADLKKDLREDADKMEGYYFKNIPADSLVRLNKIYPSDEVIGRTLASKLASSGDEKDKMLFEYLVQDFKLDRSKYTARRPTIMKPAYNVAVLFPFMVKEIDPENANRPNQFVLDMYEGIRIAVDSLKKNGVNINLYAYDTEKEISKLKSVLDLPEFASMDMVIGPVYPTHNSLVAEFALKNQIIVVNPLSTNSKILEDNSYQFLFQSSIDEQAKATILYAKENFSNPVPKNNVIIFYGGDNKDSLLAMKYKELAEANNFTVKIFEKGKPARAQLLLSDSISLRPYSHIFIASSDVTFAANAISALEVSQKSIPVIVKSEWLQYKNLSFEQLERRGVHFIHQDYLRYDDPALRDFKKAFFARDNIYPSTFAYQGYDLMLLFGKAMNLYGNNFKDSLQKAGFIPGKIFPGYDYSDSGSNKFVPITKFQQHELTLTNMLK